MASQPYTRGDYTKKDVIDEGEEVVREHKNLVGKVHLDKSNVDWQLGKSLGESLQYMYENKLWTDVSFRCKDHNVDDHDDRIRAHRAILAARSPVFQKMLFVYDNFSGDKDEQHLPTIEAAIFHTIVKYMYGDVTDLTENTVARVMEIAHMYQIKGLVEYCATYLNSILRVDNACEILELALFYETNELRDAVCDFVDEHVNQVIQTDSFMEISESCLAHLLKGDTFYAPETQIVEASDSWAKHKLKSPDSSKKDIRTLIGEGFYNLRVPSMTLDEFIKSTDNKNYYVTGEMYEIIKFIQEKEKDVQAVSCHSVVKRIPKYQTLNIEYIESTSSGAACTMIECVLLLNVSKDCEIKCVKLQNKYNYTHQKGWYDRNKINATACFVFKGKFAIDDCFEMEFNWIPSQNDEISPECPIKLSGRTMPYTMRLTFELELSKDIKVYVDENQNFREGCQTNNHTDECLKCSEESKSDDVIRPSYCRNSKHINIIKSINICNMSYR